MKQLTPGVFGLDRRDIPAIRHAMRPVPVGDSRWFVLAECSWRDQERVIRVDKGLNGELQWSEMGPAEAQKMTDVDPLVDVEELKEEVIVPVPPPAPVVEGPVE